MKSYNQFNSVMEAGDHFKNGASPKSQMSRINNFIHTMKKSNFISLRNLCYIALCTILFSACGSKCDKAVLRVSETAFEFLGSGGSDSFDIASNMDWDASSDQTWCTVSPKLGTGDATINVSVQRNTTNTPRVAKITVHTVDCDLSKEIVVTQTAGLPDPILKAEPAQLDFANSAGSKPLLVTANVVWTIASDQAWCTVSTSSGNGDASINVSVTANTGNNDRIACLTLSNSEYSLSKTILITQAAGQNDPDHILNATPAQLDFLNTAESKPLQVTANVAWTIASDQTWCTVSNSSGNGDASVNVNVTANTGNNDRIARLTLSNSQYSLSKTVVVIQQGVEASILISPSNKEIGAGATTIEITVYANVDFDVTSNVSWITVTNKTNTLVTLQTQANTTTTNRNGIVTFKQNGGSASATLTVNQNGANEPYITITPTSKEIGAGVETFNVAVSANVDFDVTPNVAWITVSQATATSVTLQAQANTATSSRTGTVTFKQKGGDKTATLTVNQAGGQATPTVTYVSFTGNDANDGKSWGKALKSISAAISITPTGSQVWVEEGSYTETTVVMKDGVSVYGGFNRTETGIADRGTRKTTLSGGAFTMTDNFNTPTVIDGFTLNTVHTIYKNVTIYNCTISVYNISGIILTVSGGVVSNSTITSTTWHARRNISITSGGKVLNCRINLNVMGYNYVSGYGVYIDSGRLEGCIITGVLVRYGFNTYAVGYSGSDNFIVNCTFYNITSSTGDCISGCNNYTAYFLGGSGSLNFVNNIVLPISLGNLTTGLYSAYNVEGLGSSASYFLDTNYAPMSSNSPAVNKGSNSFVTLDKDILGNPRIQNGTVDIGAIESPY